MRIGRQVRKMCQVLTLRCAGASPGRGLNGSLADVAFYDRGLSAAEVAGLYTGSAAACVAPAASSPPTPPPRNGKASARVDALSAPVAACADVAHRYNGASAWDGARRSYEDAAVGAALPWWATPVGANGRRPAFDAAQNGFTLGGAQALSLGVAGSWGSAEGASMAFWMRKDVDTGDAPLSEGYILHICGAYPSTTLSLRTPGATLLSVRDYNWRDTSSTSDYTGAQDVLSGLNATTSSDGTALGWAHVVVTFDAAGRRSYYVNGAAVDDDDGNEAPMREAPPFFPMVLSHALVGGDQWAYPNAWSAQNVSGFTGALNELQFYDYALSDAAVRSLAAGSVDGCRAVRSPPPPAPRTPAPPALLPPLPPLPPPPRPLLPPPMPKLAAVKLPPPRPSPPMPLLPPGASVTSATTLSARIALSGAGFVDGVSVSAQSAVAAAAASAVRRIAVGCFDA